MNKITVSSAKQRQIQKSDWGQLTWYASKEIGNAKGVTAGICEIKPGCSNPRHSHPNCEEVLYVLQGTIAHTAGPDETVTLSAGDTITIPPNIVHNASSIGDEIAVLAICFDNAERRTIGE